jgi:HK97 family phage portal protein
LFHLVHNQPNSFQTTNTFVTTLTNHAVGWGNGFAEIQKNNGKVKALHIIHPALFTAFELNEAGKLFFHFGNRKIDNDNLIHIMFGYTDNGIVAVNPITALSLLLSINYQGLTTVNNYYKHGLHSNKVMKSILGVDNKEYNKGQQEWSKDHQGSFNAGEIPNLPFGTEIQELKLEFADAQILPTILQNSKAIAGLFGVPEFLLGLGEMKYRNLEELMLAFEKITIQPIANSFRDEFTNKLLTEAEHKEEIAIEYDLNAMHTADITTRSTYLKTLKDSAIITPNMAASAEGFDEFIGGEYHYSQSQNQPLELIAKDGEFKPITNGTTVNISGGADSKPVDNNVTGVSTNIQQTALNGAQITSLLEIITSITTGVLSKETAKEILGAAFPTFTAEQISGIVDNINKDNINLDNGKQISE